MHAPTAATAEPTFLVARSDNGYDSGPASTEPPEWLEAAPEPPTPAPEPKARRKASGDLVGFLKGKGYDFRLNACDNSLEVNGERITDVTRAEMRSKLRDAGLGKYLLAADDAVLAYAGQHAYHPVRDYLAGLQWDGEWHIARLASYVTDTHSIFGVLLRHWLVGAVARAYTGTQNAVLVLDGPQGIGKSQFAQWLCPLPRLFVDSGINPDDKDCAVVAMTKWIWEVSELGATTRRADVEALKAFLSREVFTIRPPYAHFDITKPALASFIGTVNNSAGIFSDPTGSRRFWTTTVTALDWNYSTAVDVNQVWAEAHDAYKAGEPWTLNADETAWTREINETYAVEDPIENLIRKHFTVEPDNHALWTSTADILVRLQSNGLQGNTRQNQMALSATLKRMGFERKERNHQRGYLGIE